MFFLFREDIVHGYVIKPVVKDEGDGKEYEEEDNEDDGGVNVVIFEPNHICADRPHVSRPSVPYHVLYPEDRLVQGP